MPSITLPAAATGLPTRRHALAALAGAGAALSFPMAARALPAAADPILALYAERERVTDQISRCRSDAEADPLMDRWGALDREAIASPATTLAGAVASLEWIKTEYVQFQVEVNERGPDQGDRLILALLDGALGALRPLCPVAIKPAAAPVLPPRHDAALLAHAALVESLGRLSKAAWVRASEADDRSTKARPPRPMYTADMPGEPHMPEYPAAVLRAEIEAASADPRCVSDGPWMESRLARLPRIEAHEAECDRLRRLFRVDAAEAIAARRHARLREAVARLTSMTPATTAGLVAKSRAALAAGVDDFSAGDEWAEDLSGAIVRDVITIGGAV